MQESSRKNFALTPAQRSDAREALRVLDGTGLSLLDAARVAVGRGARRGTMRVREAVDRFLADKETEVTSTTYRFYESALQPLVAAHGEDAIGELGAEELGGVVAGVRNRYASIKALLGWCERQPNPPASREALKPVRLKARKWTEPEVLTIEQMRRLLEEGYEMTPVYAVLLFTGLRVHELGDGREKPKLAWKALDPDTRTMRVPAANAKTRRPRVLEALPEPLWYWVASAAQQRSAPICPFHPQQVSRRAGRILGEWPANGFRHSFASYYLAGTGDVGRTSMNLGHEGNTRLLFQHYYGLVSGEAGREFLALYP